MKNRAKRGQPLLWIQANVDIKQTDCLLWPFGKTSKGYGSLRLQGKTIHAHRAMCLLAHGDPPPNTEVAHSCGVKACVNPTHLRHASSKENASDMILHGKSLAEEKSPRAKLNADQVREIRSLVASCSLTQAEAARTFGVSAAAVSLVVKRKNWPNLS